jgi:hypothetical protein
MRVVDADVTGAENVVAAGEAVAGEVMTAGYLRINAPDLLAKSSQNITHEAY